MLKLQDRVVINEIFTSIEGEGIFCGTKTMFIRLAGCHLGCHWCDTAYALPMDSGKSYSMSEAKDLIDNSLVFNTFKVNFTGGEPLIQHVAVGELAKFIKSKGLKTYLESSCFDWQRFKEVLPYIDICKIEFKTSDSRAVEKDSYDRLFANEMECLRLALKSGKVTYIKVVVTNSTDIEEFKFIVRSAFEYVGTINIAGFIIQPSNITDEPTVERLFDFYDAVYPFYKDVRIIPQLHKLIGAR